jgi:hypothetical protein
LRSVRDERDVERYIAFNRDVNGEAEGGLRSGSRRGRGEGW